MTLHEVRNSFSHLLRAVYGKYMHTTLFKYGRQILMVFGSIVLVAASFFGYRWYRVSREESAQKQFAQYVQEYKQMQKSETKDWDRIEMLFKLGAQQQSNTDLGPYFLAFQSQILVEKDQKGEALKIMDTMLEKVSSSSPLFTLFKTKRALMRLDMADEAVQNNGLQELTQLARDEKNAYKDMALFYLGRYYWSTSNISEAKKVWQELVDQYKHELLTPSPWAQQVQGMLQQTS